MLLLNLFRTKKCFRERQLLGCTLIFIFDGCPMKSDGRINRFSSDYHLRRTAKESERPIHCVTSTSDISSVFAPTTTEEWRNRKRTIYPLKSVNQTQ